MEHSCKVGEGTWLRFVEKVAVALIVGMLVFVPLVGDELFPFSSFNMYSTNPRFVNLVEVRSLSGELVPIHDVPLRLELHPWASAAGMAYPISTLPTDRPVEIESIANAVSESVAVLHGDPFRVTVKTYARDRRGRFSLVYEDSKTVSAGKEMTNE